ncbi:MAG: hypothetical protein ISS48_00885 [Candidatus Aenigmarchaeota archaeon]|nr:hypothetical protein [Candidatus Aenigmarchaeota archaeon]
MSETHEMPFYEIIGRLQTKIGLGLVGLALILGACHQLYLTNPTLKHVVDMYLDLR